MARCGPVRISGQLRPRRAADRPVVNQGIGQNRRIHDDHAALPHGPGCSRWSFNSAALSPGRE